MSIEPVAAAHAEEAAEGAEGANARSEGARVCILARKDLRNLTRVPRMAKSLCEAGCSVVVVALRAPVEALREMCPAVEYLEVTPRPSTGKLLYLANRRLLAQRNGRSRREKKRARLMARGGWRALALRAADVALSGIRRAAALARGFFFIAPCALMLKKREQGFLASWRDLRREETAAVLAHFLRALHQWALTHAFAEAADKATRDRSFDLVQAHDNYALAAAARLAARDRAKLVYDAVELSSHRLALDLSFFERVRERLERREEAVIFRRADRVITIGDGVADWYYRHYAVPRPLVVRNCRYYWPQAVDGRLRADAGVAPGAPLVVWFGGIYPQQGIGALLKAMPFLAPNIHLAIVAYVLPRWVSYVEEELPKRAAALGIAERVHILPPRDPNDLVPYVSGADLGVIPRPSEHLANFLGMPNKLFEMVMARLPIAVSRLGDVVTIVKDLGIGEVFDERDPEDIAAVIERMLEPATYAGLKARVAAAALELNWEKESARYLAAVRALLESGGKGRSAIGEG